MPASESSSPRSWEEFSRELGVRLHQRRIAADLSQETLAHLAGITRNHYQLLESGGSKEGPTNLTIRLLVRLAHALDASVGELLPDDALVRD